MGTPVLAFSPRALLVLLRAAGNLQMPGGIQVELGTVRPEGTHQESRMVLPEILCHILAPPNCPWPQHGQRLTMVSDLRPLHKVAWSG